MYDLMAHLNMIRDPVRVDAYARALAATIRPGDRVVDVGAGMGIITFLALRCGAAHVYAVEQSEVLDLARRVARANGFDDRLTCVQADVRQADLPSPADLMVFDLRGVLPTLGDNLDVIVKARERHLAPGGRLVPASDTLFLAPVEHPKGFAAVEGWRQPIGGTDYSLVAEMAANQWWRSSFGAEALLAERAAERVLDYRELDDFDIELGGRFEIAREGRMHGLGAWFETQLAPGVAVSSAPGDPDTVYGQAFFPLHQGHPVRRGDLVEATLQARYGGRRHIWLWTVRIESPGQSPITERHSSFQGTVISTDDLRKREESHLPTLGEEGRIDRFILERMDGDRPLGEIAREAMEEFPSAFANRQEALTRAAELSARYSR